MVAGRVGFLHQQQALVQVDLHDPVALADALAQALTPGPGTAATADARLAQRLDIAGAHRELYRQVAAHAPRRDGGGTRVIGWYVHHHGAGHLQRLAPSAGTCAPR